MCGIIAILRRSGLKADDIVKFRDMIVRCEVRGDHASGIFNSNMEFIKAPLKGSQFAKTDAVVNFLVQSIGETYIVGHTRLATRGDPRINENDHPVFPENMNFFVVHNGMITCKKYDKTPDRTDTTILYHAIDAFFKTGSYFEAVSNAFDDISDNGNNSSAIITGTEHELVIAKTTSRPVVMQILDNDDLFVIGSTEDIAGLAYKETENLKEAEYIEIGDHSIVGINDVSSEITSKFLRSLPKPQIMIKRSKCIIKVKPEDATKKDNKKEKKHKKNKKGGIRIVEKGKFEEDDVERYENFMDEAEFECCANCDYCLPDHVNDYYFCEYRDQETSGISYCNEYSPHYNDKEDDFP